MNCILFATISMFAPSIGEGPAFTVRANPDPYSFSFTVTEGEKSYVVAISATSALSYSKKPVDATYSLKLGDITFTPPGGFVIARSQKADFTLGMDFLTGKKVGIDLRDRSISIWNSQGDVSLPAWMEASIGFLKPMKLKGNVTPQGLLFKMGSQADSAGTLSLASYGTAIPRPSATGLEQSVAGQPMLLTHALYLDNRPFRWPWILEVRKDVGAAPEQDLATLSLSTLRSRVVGIDFADGSLYCESDSEDRQLAFTLSEALGITVDLESDGVKIGTQGPLASTDLRKLEGCPLRSMNGVEISEILRLMRDPSPGRIRDVAGALYVGGNTRIEVETKEGEMLQIELRRNGT